MSDTNHSDSSFLPIFSDLGEDLDLFEDIVELFRESAESRISNLRRAASASNPKDLLENAHALKGSASSFGPGLVVELACQLEALGAAGKVQTVGELIENLNSEVTRLLSDLNSFIGRRRAA